MRDLTGFRLGQLFPPKSSSDNSSSSVGRRRWKPGRRGAVAGVLGLTLAVGLLSSYTLVAAAYGVVATIPVGTSPAGVAVNPATNRAYVTNYISNNVSVIDTTTNTVVATIP